MIQSSPGVFEDLSPPDLCICLGHAPVLPFFMQYCHYFMFILLEELQLKRPGMVFPATQAQGTQQALRKCTEQNHSFLLERVITGVPDVASPSLPGSACFLCNELLLRNVLTFEGATTSFVSAGNNKLIDCLIERGPCAVDRAALSLGPEAWVPCQPQVTRAS